MFLNKTRFKKMLKNAYNYGGLTVGRVYNGLVLSGNGWTVWTEEGYVPNWLKAAIMELTGELPRAECVFTAQKGEVLQFEIAENEYLDLPARFLEARIPFTVTPIGYSTNLTEYRMLQNKKTGRIIAFPSCFYDTLDFSELDKEETAPTGPSSRSEDADMMFWKNEHSAVAFHTAKTGDTFCTRTMELIKDINWGEKVN